MIEPELCDAADHRCGDDVGRIKPPAHADFEDTGIGGDPREGEERGGGGQLEESDRGGAVGVEHVAQRRDQRRVVDQATR